MEALYNSLLIIETSSDLPVLLDLPLRRERRTSRHPGRGTERWMRNERHRS